MADSTFYDLCRLSAAVYGDAPTPEGWSCIETVTGSFGFQAAAYRQGPDAVTIAFRGTTSAPGDFAADLKLGLGINTSHFSQAEMFAGKYAGTSLTVCGHSLGGAMAQIIGNRGGIRFATFNAPGVAVLASRNIGSANIGMFAVRLAGATVGALMHPQQTARDIAASFNTATGVNVCLDNDLVSQIGVHYGRVVRIPGTGVNPLTQHGVGTLVGVLRDSDIGKLRISSYFP